VGRHAAVNDEFGTLYEGGFGRSQVKYFDGDLLGCAKSIDRDSALNPMFPFLKAFLVSIPQKR
jgi:hypothetical protein